MPIIPKTIHFIWVGSRKLSAKYIENICTWTYLNPTFKIILWVDKKSMPPDVNYCSQYPEDFYLGAMSAILKNAGYNCIQSAKKSMRKIFAWSEIKKLLLLALQRSPELGAQQELIHGILKPEHWERLGEKLNNLVEGWSAATTPNERATKLDIELRQLMLEDTANSDNDYQLHAERCFNFYDIEEGNVRNAIQQALNYAGAEFLGQKPAPTLKLEAEEKIIEEQMNELAQHIPAEISLEQIKKLASEIPPRIQMIDIEETSFTAENRAQIFAVVRYTINRPEPNYGMASDLLRYLILWEYGGAYFDIDVQPPNDGKPSLESLAEIYGAIGKPLDLPDDRVFCNRIPGEEDYCNHAIVSIAHSLVIQDLLNTATTASMSAPTKIEFNIRDTYCCDNSTYVIRRTVINSGPLCLPAIYAKYKTAMFSLHSIGFSLGHTFDGSWMDRWSHLDNFEAALERAMYCIIFEIEHYGALRLDYHIWAIMQSPHYAVEDEAVSAALTERLEPLLQNLAFRQKITLAQLTFQYAETVNFYIEQNLLDKAGLFSSSAACTNPVDRTNMIMEIFFALGGDARIYDRPRYVKDVSKAEQSRFLKNSIIFIWGMLQAYEENLDLVDDAGKTILVSLSDQLADSDCLVIADNFSDLQKTWKKIKNILEQIYIQEIQKEIQQMLNQTTMSAELTADGDASKDACLATKLDLPTANDAGSNACSDPALSVPIDPAPDEAMAQFLSQIKSMTQRFNPVECLTIFRNLAKKFYVDNILKNPARFDFSSPEASNDPHFPQTFPSS